MNRESQIEIRAINFLLKSYRTPKCSQMPYNANIRYVAYFCDVPCRVICIILDQCFNLININDCWPTSMFSVFQIKISSFNTVVSVMAPSSQTVHSVLNIALFCSFYFSGIKVHKMMKMRPPHHLHFHF